MGDVGLDGFYGVFFYRVSGTGKTMLAGTEQ
jgi:ATP-dependent 26S proteasome regulatory subunit